MGFFSSCLHILVFTRLGDAGDIAPKQQGNLTSGCASMSSKESYQFNKNLPHACKRQFDALDILSKLPKPHGGTKEGRDTPLRKHTMSTTKNFEGNQPASTKGLAAHVPCPSYLSPNSFLLSSQPVHGEIKLVAATVSPLCHFQSSFDCLGPSAPIFPGTGFLTYLHSGQWYSPCLSVPSSLLQPRRCFLPDHPVSLIYTWPPLEELTSTQHPLKAGCLFDATATPTTLSWTIFEPTKTNLNTSQTLVIIMIIQRDRTFTNGRKEPCEQKPSKTRKTDSIEQHEPKKLRRARETTSTSATLTTSPATPPCPIRSNTAAHLRQRSSPGSTTYEVLHATT